MFQIFSLHYKGEKKENKIEEFCREEKKDICYIHISVDGKH